jgi:hypothetical protein
MSPTDVGISRELCAGLHRLRHLQALIDVKRIIAQEMQNPPAVESYPTRRIPVTGEKLSGFFQRTGYDHSFVRPAVGLLKQLWARHMFCR